MIVYYSGTGNSQYVAEALADRLSDRAVSANSYIRERKNGEFAGDTPWIFVFPVYIHSMAEIFADFLRRSTFTGSRKAYFVGTCASAMGISPDVGAEICREKGLEFMGAEKVVMPQNYIALFTMTPQEEIAKRLANALQTADNIALAVKAGRTLNMSLNPAVECSMFLAVGKLYNRYFTRAEKFFATDKCVGCGLCERICPLENISPVDEKPKWSNSCIHCMSCINRCPQGAIEYGKKTEDKKRYVCVKYRGTRS